MSSARLMGSVLQIVLSVLGASMTTNPLISQALPDAFPSVPGLGELVSDPGKWLMTAFSAAVATLGQKTTGDVVAFMDWLLKATIVNQTPAQLSYDNQAVVRLWDVMRTVANAGLAVVTVWGGVNVMLGRHIRAPYHGALELIPRVLLSGIMINFSRDWGKFVIDLNNALCGAVGTATIPGWSDVQQQPPGDALLLNLIGMAVYLVMGLLLIGQMLMRLALVDALLVIGPLALLCWVLPQTYTWARLWFTTFFGTIFVQTVQVVVLSLGTALIQQLPSMLPAIGSDPLGAGHRWLASLLLGMAVLQLARRIPRLMPGMPAGMGVAYTGPSIRQLTDLFDSGKNKRGGR